MSTTVTTYNDHLVVNRYGQLRHILIAKTTEQGAYREPGSMASDRLSPRTGLTFFSKPLGTMAVLDEPIERYEQSVRSQRKIDAEEKKQQRTWEKVVKVAELLSVFVPVFGVVGVTCRIFRIAETVATVIEGVDKLNRFVTDPAAVITEELLNHISIHGFKRVVVLDKVKMGLVESLVIEPISAKLVDASGVRQSGDIAAPNQKFQLNTLGYSLERDFASADSECDQKLRRIHAFRYLWDPVYKDSFDSWEQIARNISFSKLQRQR